MFRIIADTLEYDHRPIATFMPHLSATLYDNVAGLLESTMPDTISEADHRADMDRAEERAEAEIASVELERDAAKTEAAKWLHELESIDDAGGAAARVIELVEKNSTLAESVKHWRELFNRSQETIRQLRYEAKQQKIQKRKSRRA